MMTTKTHQSKSHTLFRASGAIVVASMMVPFLAGCGSSNTSTTTAQAPQVSTGLSTKQKVVLLAGAAALYYYYNKSKKANAAKAGQQIQYYRSKANGRIYYREPGNPQNVHWVTPPSGSPTYQIPESEAAQYQGYQGYDNSTSGKTLEDAFPVS